MLLMERFAEQAHTLADIVHLQEQPAKIDPKTALECARRAVRDMLYDDGACIVLRSARG